MQSGMVWFSPEVGLALAGIAGLAVLSVLGTLASLVRNSTAVHDLHIQAASLRISYARQLAEAEESEVIEVDETPAEPAKGA